MSNVNAALQLFLSRWVRARGLSVYQMVLSDPPPQTRHYLATDVRG